MKTTLLLTAALLAGTAVGTAYALTRDGDDALRTTIGHRIAGDGTAAEAPFRVADDHRRDRDRDRHGRKHHRHHDDDDDDDDDRGGRGDGRAGRMPTTGPTDPATPVPDNGLFQGKARPKVEVN